MSNFALDVNTPQGDIIASLNYVLSNLGTFDANLVANIAANVANTSITSANVVTANVSTGQLQSKTSGTIGYLYNYVNVKYANSATGSSGFSSNSANKSYYGIHNTVDGTISSNPVDYQWKQVAGGFGTTKALYYTTVGGGQIFFSAATTPPTINYQPVPDDTSVLLQSLANSIVQTSTINPGAVTNVGIATQTITTNNMAFGIITADLLAANLIIAKDIVSTNANLGNLSSAGYWFQANTGTGRFGGNLNIGNNLTIGNNAVIGGNLVVSGLITSGSLNANTVQTTTIGNNAVTTTNAISVSTGATANNPTVSYSFTGDYYYYQSTAATSSANLVVPVTTPNVSIVVNSTIDVFGWITANVNYVTQMYAQLYRYAPGQSPVALTSSFTTTPASQLFAGGSTVQATQTILPYRLVSGNVVDTFTTDGTPQNIVYRWIVGTLTGTVSFPATVTSPNISFTAATMTATNYKR